MATFVHETGMRDPMLRPRQPIDNSMRNPSDGQETSQEKAAGLRSGRKDRPTARRCA